MGIQTEQKEKQQTNYDQIMMVRKYEYLTNNPLPEQTT